MKRSIVLVFGWLTLGALWWGPLPELARDSFAAHMAMHMGVVAIAAPLLAIGVAGTSFDPVRRMPAMFPPVAISLVEFVIVWVWHAPALHHMARHNVAGLLVEQGTFFAAGFLLWLSALGGDAPLRSERAGAGVAALLLTSMHMTLLGALLALTPRVLYAHGGHETRLTPLEDQHLGGAVMLAVGGVSYLAGGLWLTAGLVRSRIRKREAMA